LCYSNRFRKQAIFWSTGWVNMRRVLRIVLVVAVVAGGYLIYQNSRAGAEEDTAAANLQTATITRDNVILAVQATGTVEAARASELGFETGGIVADVLVEEGQFVLEGQVLARLDDTAQRIAMEQAEWGVRIAELSLQQLEAPPDPRDISAAQAAVNSAWAAYVDLRDNSVSEEEIRAAELQYEQALAAWDAAEQASRDARRSEASLAQVGAASFAAEIARLRLEQLRQGVPQEALNAALARVAQAEAQLRLVEAGPVQAQLDRAAVAVRQAELRLKRAQQAYEDTILRAPFSGIVQQVAIQAGGLVVPGGLPAMALYDLSRLLIRVTVDEIDVVQIQAGQEVELTFDALPGEVFTGVVERVAATATQRGGVIGYDVTLALPDAPEQVQVGMTAAATIILDEVRDVLVVPNLYVGLDRTTGQAYVTVVKADGSLEERAVVLGVQNDTVSEVVSGLQEGDVVAVHLAGGLLSLLEDN